MRAAITVAAGSDVEPQTRINAHYLIERLAGAGEEAVLKRELREPHRVDLRRVCLIALAHAGLVRPEDDLRGLLAVPELRDTVVYALGISGHPQLSLPEADGDDARWWRANGGGFFA
ncbi:hypothetical protein HJ588_05865 [Flexivirga sp. ID2601S]|uniref:Uncharacterized protein n=1 Tax=Flexivirga aerilata TaxID=1656889 RepID=A0A849AK79_9MICO|nr:hypothetical protein [Flexivirga aerilata]NNG38800.1 hypothetical protein [Flexivirga aerilata]